MRKEREGLSFFSDVSDVPRVGFLVKDGVIFDQTAENLLMTLKLNHMCNVGSF